MKSAARSRSLLSNPRDEKLVQIVRRIDSKEERNDSVALYADAYLTVPAPTQASLSLLKINAVPLSRIDSLRISPFLDGTNRSVSGSGVVCGMVDNIVIDTTWQDIATATPR